MAVISRDRATRYAALRALQWVLPWAWAIRGVRATYAAGGHVHGRFTPAERRRFASLIWKSRGRRANLTLRERAQLRRLARKIDPRDVIRAVAAEFSPFRWPKPPS